MLKRPLCVTARQFWNTFNVHVFLLYFKKEIEKKGQGAVNKGQYGAWSGPC